MKNIFVLALVIICSSSIAQNFIPFDVTKLSAHRVKQVSICDFDNDGLDDLIAVGGMFGFTEGGTPETNFTLGFEKVFWFKNLGNDNYSQRIVLSDEKLFANDIATADVDGDGDIDIVFSDYEVNSFDNINSEVKIIWNDGSGNVESIESLYYAEVGEIEFSLLYFNDNLEIDLLIENSVEESEGAVKPPTIYLDFISSPDPLQITLTDSENYLLDYYKEGGLNYFAISEGVLGNTQLVVLILEENGFVSQRDTLATTTTAFVSGQFFDANGDGLTDLFYSDYSQAVSVNMRTIEGWSANAVFNVVAGPLFKLNHVENSTNFQLFYSTSIDQNSKIFMSVFDHQLSEIFVDSIKGRGNIDLSLEIKNNSNQQEVFIYNGGQNSGFLGIVKTNLEVGFLSENPNYLANDTEGGFVKAIGDIDSDGYKDVLVKDGYYKNLQQDTFSTKIYYADSIFFENIILFEDLNQDNITDIIYSNELGKYIAFGTGDLHFTEPLILPFDYRPGEGASYKAMAVVLNTFFLENDVIMLADNYTSSSSNGTIIRLFKISSNNSIEVIHVYDLENLIIRCSNIHKFETSTTNESIEAFIMYDESVFLGENKIFYLSSQNTFEASIIPAEFNSIRTLKIHDFNDDGLDDVVSCNGTFIKVFFQTQNFQFINVHSIVFTSNQFNDIELLDVDLDGDLDILFSNRVYPKLQAIMNEDVFLNYSISTIDSSFGSIRDIKIIDLDDDNIMEIITSSNYYVDSRIVYYSMDQGVVTTASNNFHAWDNKNGEIIKIYHAGGILNLNKIIDHFENAYIISIDGRMMTQINHESESRLLQLKPGIYIIKFDSNEE